MLSTFGAVTAENELVSGKNNANVSQTVSMNQISNNIKSSSSKPSSNDLQKTNLNGNAGDHLNSINSVSSTPSKQASQNSNIGNNLFLNKMERINTTNLYDTQTQSFLNQPTSNIPSSQLSTGIESWGNLTISFQSGLQKIQSFYPSSMLVKVNSNNKVEFVVKLHNMNELSFLSTLFKLYNIDIESKVSSLGIVVVWVPLPYIQPFIKVTENNNYVSYVEPNGYVHVQFAPNDPLFPQQWGPQLIGMTSAWNQVQNLGSRSVKVAVIDTGIDYNNPELKGNYLPLGYNWVSNNSNPMDDNGHGTHVSGTIAAAINNGLGIAGLANVSIFAEKFLDSNGFGSDVNAALAINHAVAQGANILSNSWGGSYNSSLVADAVANAIQKGVIVVAAAGNANSNASFFPVDLPGVVGVAATDSSDQRASFSNYGNYVDISAPGVNILSTWLNDTYAYESGTSMATPHVSGLLALLMSKYPSDNASQLESIIYKTAIDLGTPGWDPYYGWGRIDAASAIYGLQQDNVQANIVAPSVFPVDLNSTFNASIRNIGLNTENNIAYKVLINGSIVTSGKVSTLDSGMTTNIPVSVFPLLTSTYNLTLIIDPVPGEIDTIDNTATRYVQALTKQIDLKVGDILAYVYNPTNSTNPLSSQLAPFDYAFNVTAEISPTTYNVSYIAYENFGGSLPQLFTLFTSLVNPYTREMTNGPWGLFPFWINTTGLQINDKVDLFTKGGQEGTVVGISTYNYYGVQKSVLLINDTANELISFDNSTGALLSVVEPFIQGPFFVTSYTNVQPAGFSLHNLKGIVTNTTISPGTASPIYFMVMNTGTYTESSNALLTINNTLQANYNFTLGPGQVQLMQVIWTPPTSGTFPLQLTITPVADETFLSDNTVNVIITVSSTFIVSYVYDSITGLPISGAEVDIFNANNGSLIETGLTNATGTFQSTNLPLGNYLIQVTKTGYYPNSIFITISNAGEVEIYFFMYPAPQESVIIISPTTNQTVLGGLVNVNYYATNIFLLNSISIYDNNVSIGTTYVFSSGLNFLNNTGTIIVPIFSNGTNTITLSFLYFDGSMVTTSVTINSEKVTPLIYPKLGDSMFYNYTYSYTSEYEIVNITFGNWITSTEINVTVTITDYFNGIISTRVLFYQVNVLNEFENDSFDMAYGYTFQYISNLGYTNPNGHGAIGDITPNISWADILTINGTTTLKGVNAWTLANDRNETWIYSRLTGILLKGVLNYGTFTVQLINSSFPLTAPAPTVTAPSVVLELLGTTGNTLSWCINGSYPDIYTIFKNGTEIANGRWISDQNVTINIDGLTHGVYGYTLIAYNAGGWYTVATIAVKAVDIPKLNSPPDIEYHLGTFGEKITWLANDSDPNTFSISRDDSFVSSGSWRTGVPIVIAVDVLPMGVYNFSILVTDLEAFNATDSVLVHVLSPSRHYTTPGFGAVFLILGLISIAIVSKKLRKKKLSD